ncbi:MAG: TonB-dependent siderophore receptor [Pseudorhodoferax sp.]
MVARAALGLSACLLALAPAQAQDAAAAQAAQRRFDIPAGPLEATLNRIGREAGVLISFGSAATDGLRSPGVQGAQGVEEALSQALAGTGLGAVRAAGGYALRALPAAAAAAPAGGPAQGGLLRQVDVTAAADHRTEGSGAYTAPRTQSATPLELSLRETPQTVSVLTRQRLDDQNLQSFNEVVRATPGLSVLANGVGADDVRFHARGFPVENLLLDGMPLQFNGFAMPSLDMVMVDRVDVVRGAPGLMVGTGNPSAAINLVRKRPTAEPLAAVSLSAGSWDRYGATVDLSNALNAAGTLRGRLAASWQDKHSFIDVAQVRSHALYGIVEADLTPRTTLAVGAAWQDNATRGVTWGLPADRNGQLLPYARSTFYGTPWSTADRSGRQLFADLRHLFDNGWEAKAALLSMRSEGQYITPYYWRNASWTQPFTVTAISGGRTRQDEVSGNLSFSGPVQALGREHGLAFGIAAGRRDTDGSGSFGGALQSPGWMTVLEPAGIQALAPPGAVTLEEYAGEQSRQKSVYAAARLRLTQRLSTVLGSRLTWYEHHSETAAFRLTRELTPYAGLTLDLDDVHTVYLSHTGILQPQTAVDAQGRVLDPVTGNNLEAGVKAAWFGGRLNASAAVFQIRQRNRAMQDEDGPSPCPSTGAVLCSRAAGEVKTKGVDLELSGAPREGLNLAAGYTYAASRYVKDSVAANIGQPFNTRLPRHQFKLFGSLRLPGEWQRWTAGASLYGQSSMYNGTTARIQQGGYWTTGLMLGYKASAQVDLRLNVENLFDRRYYEALGYVRGNYSSNNWYGAPRNAMLTLNWRMQAAGQQNENSSRFVGYHAAPMELSASFTRALLNGFGPAYAELLRIATRSAGSRDAARELVHDTWLRLAEHAQAGAPEGGSADLPRDATAYLAVMAQHLALDQHRRGQRLARHVEEEARHAQAAPPLCPDVAESVMYRQALAVLEQALAELPARCRTVFLAHRLHGEKLPAIAERLSVSVNTVERDLILAGDRIEAALLRWRGTPAATRRPGRRRSLAALLGVAGLGVGGTLGWRMWQQQLDAQVLWQAALDSPHGRQTRHGLPDGTSVQLDAQSHAEVQYLRHARRVQLVQGAAFFAVAHVPERPFTVDAGPVRVTVLGTRFGVERLPGGTVLVQVESGRVRVAGPGLARELGAGEALRVQADGQVQALAAADPAPWRHGELVFLGTPLHEALARLARYAPYALTATPAAAQLPVSGRVRIAQARAWLNALPQVLPVRVREGEGGAVEIALRPS